jgi:alpha-tubulin suppressor-like RCC1 family protein
VTAGKAFSWSYNRDGQLGNGNSGPGTNRSTPATVIGLDNVSSISGGTTQSLAVLEGAGARSWGDSQYGQLGTGNTGTNSDVPVAVKNLAGVTNLDEGYGFALAAAQ